MFKTGQTVKLKETSKNKYPNFTGTYTIIGIESRKPSSENRIIISNGRTYWVHGIDFEVV